MTINGFMVVRLPHLNHFYDDEPPLPAVEGIYYAGVERQPWVDVCDQDYDDGKAPPDIRSTARIIDSYTYNQTGVAVCSDANVAAELLAYANRNGFSNEVIAVRAPDLDLLTGTIDTEVPVEWMGFDFMVFEGGSSPIAEGIF
ncbi:MAG: hypothetical protein GTN62_02970, partial [Gemmatimonadales bacterium]|nr:hypothetical protein [Gemmatimonadales bacterium]NIN49062.1 hypothetical protein [Gemmatimonadales bacterium]NIP06526.1 hypothetical protein [Gemmatimonadales bacterium]NIR00225.1 hypothetical protein [Gemmatimonadales bacterium]NIS64566.1 hypothetical protein [Gemmatimonadales bacterium]